MCAQYDMPYEKMKLWYDGYDLKGEQIYNPRSVVMSLLGYLTYDFYEQKVSVPNQRYRRNLSLAYYSAKKIIWFIGNWLVEKAMQIWYLCQEIP